MDLGKVFPEGDLVDQLLDLAELPFGRQFLCPVLHLLQRVDIGGQPGKAVGRALLCLDRAGRDAAIAFDALTDIVTGRLKQEIHWAEGLCRQFQEIGKKCRHACSLVQAQLLSVMCHDHPIPFSLQRHFAVAA